MPTTATEPTGEPVVGFWRVAAAYPDRPAVVDADGTVTTYGELLATARGIASTLRSLGIGPGDHIAMALPNHRAYFEVVLAGMENGLVVTPVNSHLAAAEVAYVLADSRAQVFVTHEALAGAVVGAVAGAGLAPDRCFGVGTISGFRPYAELVGDDDGPPEDRRAGMLMMYTSGTTGKPKGVKRPPPGGDPDQLFGTMAVITCGGFGIPVGEHRHLVNGPLYHAGPWTGAGSALHAGATLVLMDRWTPEGCLELIERHQVASTQMVPTMFHRLLALPDDVRAGADVSSIRSVFHTGAPCPVHVKSRMMEWWGPVVYETYGGTEGGATIATPRRWLSKPGTVGKAVHGATVHILDAEGAELPPGEVGDIWFESRAAPAEYFNDAGKSEEIRRGRMVTLGDMGFLDEDGFLFLRDRKIDMIISGGVNIYPAEVEAALLADPDIADVAVIGVPDAEWGEQVKAIVELRAGLVAGPEVEAAIIDRCRERIARFKCPRSVDFVDVLPRLPSGKLQKRVLREPYWAGVGRAI